MSQSEAFFRMISEVMERAMNILPGPMDTSVETQIILNWYWEFLNDQAEPANFWQEILDRAAQSHDPADLARTFVEDLLAELEFERYGRAGLNFLAIFIRRSLQAVDWRVVGHTMLSATPALVFPLSDRQAG